jgi:hypothetical protein
MFIKQRPKNVILSGGKPGKLSRYKKTGNWNIYEDNKKQKMKHCDTNYNKQSLQIYRNLNPNKFFT